MDEQRDRMAEAYVAVGDALARVPSPVYLVRLDGDRRLPRPAYLPGARQTQTAAEYRGALAKLGKLGIVRSN